jgi:proteasome lid subunit RPN8/RPN11
MWRSLVDAAARLLSDFNRSLRGQHSPARQSHKGFSVPATRYQPLKRVVLTDGVGRTLFEEYAAHQAGTRGNEETGWVVLGLRQEDEATLLATLPAGTLCDASVGHVQFNSSGQALASRIVRQIDRRLTILGVVHTHPGSLRHPSDGDLRGDSDWVGQLRGREGIFGIGTADCRTGNGTEIAQQPRPNVQCLGKLRLSWYALSEGDRTYRPLPIGLTLGPDLARPLHSVWSLIEAHANRLDRLCRQQTGVTFDVTAGEGGPLLAVTVPLADAGNAIRVLLAEKQVQYYLLRNGEPFQTDPGEDRIDRAVYLLLAELAAQKNE